MSLPDFEAWAIFAKVAELGSFSRAAAELALSKATISKAVTRLEARLGAPLFHRSSRRLSLTESGRVSLDRAQRILSEGEAVEAEVTERVAEPRGLIRLTAPLSFGIANLGEILPQFLTKYPQISLDLRLTDRKMDLVAEGIDVALRIGVLEDSSLRARQLYPIRRVLVASPTFIAQHGMPTHPRELEALPALLFTQVANAGAWQFRHPIEGEFAVRMTGRFYLDNGDVALPALAAGIALAIMPEFLVWQQVRDGQLVELLPGWEMAPTGLHVVTPPGAVRPARVVALIETLAQHFRRAPWAYGASPG
ncbi:LysR family transcriptional regulator [Acidisphaera sp. L21]|uniref:LysR family transcriptional regulator n=1 Tax=Acidisphaera sp. L21 TaxID=1641851 RepID=UPI00131EAF72|nr:LysR family transcriptional regulator [Acidisphaera sp. L21]